MTLIDYLRALGVRRGLRWWWAAGKARSSSPAGYRIHHGAKPSMPGYRRRRSR
jgi:hypothetical protein